MTRLRYSDLRLIGQGGFAEVYWATERGTDRSVALKVLSPRYSLDADATGRFEREIFIMRELTDVDGVLAVLDDGVIANRLFYASEFHPQGSLDRLTGRPMDPLVAAAMVSTVAATLTEVHRRGILHRDIKPSNLLLTADGDVVIADFGVGWIADDRTTTAGFVGSHRFAAPEVIALGASAADQRADVYSLGVVGLELLKGSDVREDPSFVAVSAVFEEATQKDPASRTPSMVHLAAAVDRILAISGDAPTIVVPGPIALPAPGETPDPTRGGRRSARRVAIAAALVTIASAVGWLQAFTDDEGAVGTTGRPATESRSIGSEAAAPPSPAAEGDPRLDLDAPASSSDALEVVRFAARHELDEVLFNVSLTDFEGAITADGRGRELAFIRGTCAEFCEGDAYEISLEGVDEVTDSVMYYDSGALVLRGRFVVQGVSIETGGVYSVTLRALDLA